MPLFAHGDVEAFVTPRITLSTTHKAAGSQRAFRPIVPNSPSSVTRPPPIGELRSASRRVKPLAIRHQSPQPKRSKAVRTRQPVNSVGVITRFNSRPV